MSLKQKEETEKLFYSISEVSEMFELNASTIRFWEKEFEVLKPNKNKKGNRLYTQKDIDNISRIVTLVKQQGFTIQGARDQLRQKSGQTQQQEVVDRLKQIKERLLKLRDSIE